MDLQKLSFTRDDDLIPDRPWIAAYELAVRRPDSDLALELAVHVGLPDHLYTDRLQIQAIVHYADESHDVLEDEQWEPAEERVDFELTGVPASESRIERVEFFVGVRSQREIDLAEPADHSVTIWETLQKLDPRGHEERTLTLWIDLDNHGPTVETSTVVTAWLDAEGNTLREDHALGDPIPTGRRHAGFFAPLTLDDVGKEKTVNVVPLRLVLWDTTWRAAPVVGRVVREDEKR